MAAAVSERFLPAFLTGIPRSCSSLTQKLLNHHPDVEAGDHKSDLAKHFGLLVMGYSNSIDFRTAHLANDRALWEGRLREAVPAYMERMLGWKPGLTCVDHSRGWLYHLRHAWGYWPEAKVILTVRDLRDVAASHVLAQDRAGGIRQLPASAAFGGVADVDGRCRARRQLRDGHG